MRNFLLLLILCISISQMYGQEPGEGYGITHRAEYMLPSAEAISRIKPVYRPAGLSTGIPKIYVPLWTNNFSDFSIYLPYFLNQK